MGWTRVLAAHGDAGVVARARDLLADARSIADRLGLLAVADDVTRLEALVHPAG